MYWTEVRVRGSLKRLGLYIRLGAYIYLIMNSECFQLGLVEPIEMQLLTAKQ